jgi:chemotaxis protein CheD
MKYNIISEVDIFLMPGELHVTQQPTVISTLLGSCVSVVLYHKPTGLAAISHAQIPQAKTGKCSVHCPARCNQNSDEKNEFRYVTCSTRFMLEKFAADGIDYRTIDVKIFGGSNVLGNITGNTIGDQNIAMIHSLIEQFNLRVISNDTAGNVGRTIYFYTKNGDVLVRKHIGVKNNGDRKSIHRSRGHSKPLSENI